jgi:hypothetical protein
MNVKKKLKRVKLSLCLVKHHKMKTYGEVEEKLHNSWPRHYIS